MTYFLREIKPFHNMNWIFTLSSSYLRVCVWALFAYGSEKKKSKYSTQLCFGHPIKITILKLKPHLCTWSFSLVYQAPEVKFEILSQTAEHDESQGATIENNCMSLNVLYLLFKLVLFLGHMWTAFRGDKNHDGVLYKPMLECTFNLCLRENGFNR